MIDTNLLESFLAVAEQKSFTFAAERMGLTQSTVSQHIRRLEGQLEQRLFHRSTHNVTLLPEGERLLPHARRILSAIGDAERDFATPGVTGHVSMGVAEDFATSRLPDILKRFRRFYPGITLQIEVGLSGNLLDKFHSGFFDIVLVKTRTSTHQTMPLMADPLVWVASPDEPDLYRQRPLPLALHPDPSVSRNMAIEALNAAHIPFIITHTSLSITGLRAGVIAGLGVSAFGRHFIPDGVHIIDAVSVGLPVLPDLPFVIEQQKGMADNQAVSALIRAIHENVSMLDQHTLSMLHPSGLKVR
ncbi:LysR family transcriptional regulator [Acetobacter thailandicus]|uniref:LysR family transcriptional regulator n=1 Tax=Acetobacter thailandicus TaxID=1502842 RepID=UPI001BAC52BC|nr:LysR family transcriptional regulator [Acetobacter thailandicus]MBS0979495.1 LysR family transcriptional regulator [Acetobacter thailandicus]